MVIVSYELRVNEGEKPISPHTDPFWLDKVRKEKRTLKDIKRYEPPQKILRVIEESPVWHYKTDLEFHEKRDRALLALLYLTGGRVNEVLKVKKSLFDFSDRDFIIIRDFEISKRKARTLSREGIPKIDVALPRDGSLLNFTEIVMAYYRMSDEKLFKFGRKRAWAIVNYMTGKWCHYFRSQRISDIINRIRSSDATSKILGIKNPQTISHYYKGTWEEYREELQK